VRRLLYGWEGGGRREREDELVLGLRGRRWGLECLTSYLAVLYAFVFLWRRVAGWGWGRLLGLGLVLGFSDFGSLEKRTGLRAAVLEFGVPEEKVSRNE